MSEETVLKSFVDPDFGALELIEVRTMAGVDGGPMRPLVYRTWRSAAGNAGASILISCEDDPLHVGDSQRADYRRIVGDLDGLKADVARSMFSLAKDWAGDGGIDSLANEMSFAKLLKIDGYTIDPGRVTVWVTEDADIFAGHVIEVCIENGAISEIGLAG